MDIFTMSLLVANALAVIVSKSSRFFVEGVIAVSITSAFFKPRVLIVFFYKVRFFLAFFRHYNLTPGLVYGDNNSRQPGATAYV